VTSETQATSGSPVWQAVFISFGLVLILFEIVRGWRLGLLRQLMRLVALGIAYAAAFFGGRLLVPITRPFFKMPDFVLSALAGALLAFVAYAVVSSMGTILFKRTGEQDSRIVQLIYGFAGAVVGLFFGFFALWLIVVSVRAVGAVADAQVRSRSPTVPSAPDSISHAVEVRRRFLGDGTDQSAAFAVSLARLKNSLELGALGNTVKQADPVPQKTYDTLTKAVAVFSTPERARKFLSFPGARELSEHPKIVALRDDPEISEMIAQKRFLDLLQDQRIIDAANDPALAERIKKFDLRRALDYAIDQKQPRIDTNEH
jgi:membrane protein required for colicin V production